MTFEGKLARRYIFAQKRHSILTVCSIAIAAAMMTMIFVLVHTMTASRHAHIYNTQFPHHAAVCSPHAFTQAQLDALKADPAVKDCGFFAPEDYFTVSLFNEGKTRYTPESVAGQVWSYYHDHENYSENDLKQLKAVYGDDYIKEAGIVYPDADAKPVWIDFTFRLKEPDNAQSAALEKLTGDAEQCQIIPNHSLMQLDYIGMEGKFSMALMFAMVYIFIILLAFCLRMVIDTAFEISSKERERQFGVLQSVGATRKQAVRIITHEGAILSLIGIPIGLALGTGLGYLTYRMVLATNIMRWSWGTDWMKDVRFRVGAVSLGAAALTAAVWVFLSAYGTGMRMLKKKSPIEAVRTAQSQVRKVRKHSLFGLLFGWVGGLAARNVRRSKKRYIVTVVSLAASITLVAAIPYASDAYRNVCAIVAAEAGTYTGLQTDLEIQAYADADTDEARAALVKQLEDTGYFEQVRLLYEQIGKTELDEPKQVEDFNGELYEATSATIVLLYLNETDYNRFFGGKPEMSYEEFRQHGGYALLNGGQYHYADGDLPVKDGRLTVRLPVLVPLTEERRAELLRDYEAEHRDEPDHPEKAFPQYDTGWDSEKNESIRVDAEIVRREITIPVFGPLTVPEGNAAVEEIMSFGPSTYRLIAPLEEYEKLGDDKRESAAVTIMADIRSDNTYESAVNYLKSDKRFNIDSDIYSAVRLMEAGVSAFDTTVRMLSILISLIAVVSMINVITTGILNRKAELAGMRSVGMTRRQMRGLLFCESVQFVIGGIIGALLVTSAAVWGTRWLAGQTGLPELADQLGLNYSKPVPLILAAGAGALVVALLAAFIPLRRMEKEPIVDSLRAFD